MCVMFESSSARMVMPNAVMMMAAVFVKVGVVIGGVFAGVM